MNQNFPGPSVVLSQGTYVYDVNGERVEAWTREEAIKKLTDQRAANNKPIGDPQRDIDLYIQKMKIPFSEPIPMLTTHSVPEHTKMLIERVHSWIEHRKQGHTGQLTFVSQAEAHRRSVICFACPKNQSWKDSCRSCRKQSKDYIDSTEIQLTQDRKTPFHERMFACQVGGHSNKVAVHLQEPHLRHRVNYKFPSKCWLNSLEKVG